MTSAAYQPEQADLGLVDVYDHPRPAPGRRSRPPRTEFEEALAERYLDGDSMKTWGAAALFREELIKRFGFGALSGAMVEALVPWGPFLEIGAGNGYWAHELRLAGADVIATNLHCPPWHWTKSWGQVEEMGASAAVRRHGAGRTLLSVWPEHGEVWAGRALRAYREKGGSAYAYMGEGRGGCTGDANLFDELNRHWAIAADVPSLSWVPGHGDRLRIYRRRSP